MIIQGFDMSEAAHSTAERLVYNHSEGQRVIAEVQGNSIVIHDEVMRASMQNIGIHIPASDQKSFGSQKVYLEEGNQDRFIEAFKKYYCKGMPKGPVPSYQWVPLFPGEADAR